MHKKVKQFQKEFEDISKLPTQTITATDYWANVMSEMIHKLHTAPIPKISGIVKVLYDSSLMYEQAKKKATNL